MDFEPQILVDKTNVAASTYRAEFSMQDNQYCSIHIRISGGVTMYIYGTNDVEATTASDTGWIDMSSLIFGAASIADTEDLYFVEVPLRCSKYMIKYVTADATNAIKVMLMRTT